MARIIGCRLARLGPFGGRLPPRRGLIGRGVIGRGGAIGRDRCGLRAVFGGEVIAESDAALVLSEKGYPPRVYFPPAEVRGERLARTEHTTRCPWKGQAAYWTVSAGGETLKNGAWAYPEPLPELAALAGYVSFYEAVTVEG